MQVAAYELILDRRLGTLYDVPDGWYIVAAGNRTKDGAVARAMSSALANRFCHLELTEAHKSWVDWGWKNGIHPSVLAFIRFRPDLLLNMTGNRERGWPSPRTWARVSLEMQLAETTGLSNRALSHIIEGLVGVGGELGGGDGDTGVGQDGLRFDLAEEAAALSPGGFDDGVAHTTILRRNV